ncbi:MAG: hypothetical protein JJU13_12290 [Balneolaceae bacterium]|nr:hypothetical protein [Balneolaceae bacterium]
MKDKLTLRVDRDLIQHAKRYARKEGTSVSKMVSDYFKALQSKSDDDESDELPPKVSSLSGILKTKIDETDYKKHLEKKHLS